MKNVRRNSLAHAIMLVTSAGLVAPSLSYAADDAVMEEVVVTGSRIKTNADAAQPVTSFTSEAFTRSGFGDIVDVLNDSPALLASTTAANSLDSSAQNTAGSNNIGGSALNLRGLGIERTLTLVNGRRHVAGIEGTSAIDVSTIPNGLIERVEVLSGGASAVYGADAVTGVVNFILKDDYEGFELTAEAGQATQDSYGTSRINLLGGLNFDEGRGNITVSVQFDQDDGLQFGDREQLANNGLSDNLPNPALRFQSGDIDASSTPNLAAFYDFATTGQFNKGLRIPSADSFAADYETQFGTAPTLTSAETALLNRAASAPPQAILPGSTFSITSPYGVVALGDFGLEVPLGAEPDLNGNGTSDCLDSFTGYNSSLDGTASFGAAGGCWVIGADGQPRPYTDGMVSSNFNQFGASDSYIAPNRQFAIPRKEQYSIDVNGHYQVTDTMTAFWETKYVNVVSEVQEGAHNFTDLLYGAPDNPYLPAQLAPFANNAGVGFLGGPAAGGLRMSRDSDDWGDNLTTSEREVFRIVTGLEGSIGDLEYEVSLNYGKFERNMIDREEVILDRFFAAIDAVTDPTTGNVVCRSELDASAFPQSTPFNIPGYAGDAVPSSFFTFTPGDGQCAPMNIWGGRGAMSQASIDFVTANRPVNEEIEQLVFSAFVTGDSAKYFSLPGGAVAFSAGIEYRDEDTAQSFGDLDQGILPVSGVTFDGQAFAAGSLVGDVSDVKSLIQSTADTRVLSGSANYDFLDWYIEVNAPLLSGVFLAEELTLEAAFRQSDNSVFGSNDTYKLGGVWAPIDDVQFRYTYSEATRVPNLFELFSPDQGARFRPADPCEAANIQTAADPALRQANCTADLQANGVPAANLTDASGNYSFVDPLSAGFAGVVGGNSNLNPEVAETQSFGVVLRPSFAPSLSFTVDYIAIDIEDAITAVSSQNIVDRCYDSASLNNPFCALISRNDNPTSAQSGGLDFLRQAQLNFGAAEYEGYDYALNYGLDVMEYAISTSVSYTQVKKLNLIEPGTPGQAGAVDVELGEMRRPAESGTASIGVSRGGGSVTWSTSYLGQQTLTYEDGAEIETALSNYGLAAFTDKSTYIHDVRASYSWDNFTFYGGVSNLTDEKPFLTERAYPVSPVGRYGFLGLSYKVI